MRLATMLKDYDFCGKAVRTTVGAAVPATDQRTFRFSAAVNVFSHPNGGVARWTRTTAW
jgi:hypothetical protein